MIKDRKERINQNEEALDMRLQNQRKELTIKENFRNKQIRRNTRPNRQSSG